MPTAPVVAAVAFFVAGIVAWRMTSLTLQAHSGFTCPPGTLCAMRDLSVPPPHRLHPLRAEFLLGASGICAVVAVASAFRQWRRPCAAPPGSG